MADEDQHPDRDAVAGVVAADGQREDDDTGGLGGVLQAVAERHGRGRAALGVAEAAGDLARGGAAEHPQEQRHDQVADDDAGDRRDDHRDDDLVQDAAPLHGRTGRERGAGEAADERVGGRRRQAVPPGQQVPADGADQRGADEDQALRCRTGRR